jgi:hypothetical protein
MGLLEDAIRDHLELKRRQGADPEVIAEKERQALAPVVPDEPATWGLDHAFDADALAGEYDLPAAAPVAPAHPDSSLEARAADMSVVGQETAEFDMSELLGHDGGEAGQLAPVRAGRLRRRLTDRSSEWEGAADVFGASPAEAIPGQESMAFE